MKPQLIATISERLKEAMNLRNMKQAELSRLTGIDKSSISSYIAGRYEPKDDKIYLMASALDVSPAWLAGFNVETKNEPSENDSSLSDVKNQVIELIKNLPDEKVQAIYDLLDKLF